MTIKELLVKFRIQADTKAIDQVNNKLGVLQKIVAGFVALKALSFLKNQAEHLAELGQETTVLAKAAGLGVEEYQRLAYAAQQNGIEAQRLGISLTRLNKQMIGAKNGTKSAVAMFAKAGISREQIASFNTTSDALYALQDAFADMKGPDAQAKKLAIVAELFGRGAHNFLLFMDQGSMATKKLERDAERAAAVMSTNTVKEMAALQRAFLGVGRSLNAFFATMLAGFSPMIRTFIYRFQRLLGSNRKRLEKNVQSFVQIVDDKVSYLYGVALGLLQKFTRAVPSLGNVINNFLDGISSMWHDMANDPSFVMLKQGFQDIWASISAKHVDKKLFAKGIAEVGEGAIASVAKLIVRVLSVVAASVGEILSKAWDGIVEWVKVASPQTYKFFKETFGNVLDLVANFKNVMAEFFNDILVWSAQIVAFWQNKLGWVAKLFGGWKTSFSDASFFGGEKKPGEGATPQQEGPPTPYISGMPMLTRRDDAAKAMREMLKGLSGDNATAALKAINNAAMPPSGKLPIQETRVAAEQGRQSVASPAARLTVPIVINAPNSDPQNIARLTKDAVEEVFGEHMRQAHGKTSPQVAK